MKGGNIMKVKTLVNLTPEVYDWLRKKAFDLHLSRSDFIELLIVRERDKEL
jgi:hypothetical protein